MLRGKKKKIKNKPWFNSDLKALKKELDYKCKKFQKEPSNPFARSSFFKFLKFYRKIRKSTMKKYRKELLDQLDNLYNNNPKEYWKLVDKLKYNECSNSKESNIDISDWQRHFEELNKDNSNREKSKWEDKLNQMEKELIFNDLDFIITEKEVFSAIKSLKNGKSSGFSKILNEMLKHGQTVLGPLITKSFNHIFSTGIYPKIWSLCYVVPLHKRGSIYDPSNYRGITISDNVSKLFNSILNTRLSSYFKKKNIVCKEQIGFTSGCRTTDHLFVLRTLVNKYVKGSSKPLYACFVDFKNAFPSVPHLGLFYKLKLSGIGSKFYNIVKGMYQNIELCVKIDNRRSNFFHSSLGVRQGDNLSPILFNLYLSDLPTCFDESCDPVSLSETSFSCLLYADDLVLLSTSEERIWNYVKETTPHLRNNQPRTYI